MTATPATTAPTTCLVTGGAGFIGCAVSSALSDAFDRVIAIDNLHPQVHPHERRPRALDSRVEFVHGDVTDAAMWDALLPTIGNVTVVVHLAAETGTGQSLTEATRHASVNVVGTTELLDALVRHERLPERIVLTSSRAVYGEGDWRAEDGSVVSPGQRSAAMLARGEWDFPGLTALPHRSATVAPAPTSVYGSTKLAQEHVLRSWCLAMRVTPVLFRLQNVYGPGQSLTNPYTGIVSFFAQRARAGEVIPVYEDGHIVRDFVYIDDVVDAVVRGVTGASTPTEPSGHGTRFPFDIGSGTGTTILQLAKLIAEIYGAPEPTVTGQFRNGDVRSASAVIDDAVAVLGWRPKVPVDSGVRRLCTWIDAQLDAQAPGGAS
ncbi:epimerase/dehydratase [Pseudoclavibacter endophyticus]|uniref:SDR family NAD(P)-dependent oxidoreductase n=1 Tax=Pseudoclavibacter endophyticus TaxID=1778590 RepID=A0A6H9WS23_9MICO|nr:SDR family NAD(P)-dependent oxidoreductase [Pseudoclavibacter endophyticus]KAB1649114.1 SDR family NAD(P)-dependent oxidoreductase [Pseudoclavibacter endophyticus]GGA65302.1 epimerase/dehydratase [Pseudoclavibacter endophyticus]